MEANAAHGYPRPMLVRANWTSLDGSWDFAIDAEGRTRTPDEVKWSRRIRVPFAPEAPASGVHETGLFRTCWYRREFKNPKLDPEKRLILHFGAVDYQASVWVNDRLAVRHEGGYTPFSVDITDLLRSESQQTIVVRADDDERDLAKPRGKQDWKLEPHSIWYYRTTGIWQSVWLEQVNAKRIDSLRWSSNIQRWEIGLLARITPAHAADLRLRVRLSANDRVLVEDIYAMTDGKVERAIQLPDPGIDDARNELLWSPASPKLIDAELQLIDADEAILDAVSSYAAIRSIDLSADRVLLNGRPIQLQLVLNQGYWPDGGMTAPDDAAYRRDVELIKEMGFNGCRMHQKIESPRFLYWADKLGLMVWEEMPSAYQFSDVSISRLTKQWTEAIERDASHPCIVAWVPFNESWGVPDLPTSPPQRHAVQALYHLTKSLDPARPVISNDGWEVAATDIVGIHDYESDAQRLARRYDKDVGIGRIFETERPGHRILILSGFSYAGQPIVLSEFGGIAYSKNYNGTWGYSRARTRDDLAARYIELLSVVRSLPIFAGFCYTQFTDTYQEANGLLYMDRKPKFSLKEMACATRGAQSEAESRLEARWRERLTGLQESVLRG